MILMPDGTMVPNKSLPPWQKIITTWRRNWGRERTKYGPEMHCDGEGNIKRIFEIYEEYPLEWSHGAVVRDTPPLVPGIALLRFSPREPGDVPEVIGKYVNRKATGEWVWEHPGEYRIVQHWEDGRLHGPTQIERKGKVIMTMNFAAGHLVDANGQMIPSELFEDLKKGNIDARMLAELTQPRSVEFIATPLKEASQVLCEDRPPLNLIIDRRHCNLVLPVTQTIQGADLASALVLLITPYGLDCDYRHGCLWITSANRAKESAIFHLARRVETDVIDDVHVREVLKRNAKNIEFIDTPLVDVIAILIDTYRIPIFLDPSCIDKRMPVTLNVHDINLQSALGALCDLHELDCDYRYGAIWFTAPQIEMWSDPTGVAAINPLPGSPIEAAWNDHVANNSEREEPLTSFVTRLSLERGVDVDISQVDEADQLKVRAGRRTLLPLKHVLGAFLYENGLQCRLDGERLVIFPAVE